MAKFSRVVLVLVAIGVVGVLLRVSNGPWVNGDPLKTAGAAAATGGISFETPSIADPIHTFGEPDIGIDPQGRVFVSGPTGTGTQRSVWFGSVDGGHSLPDHRGSGYRCSWAWQSYRMLPVWPSE